jgi:riboflavin biosynthesis pyrimidine reductase
MAAGKWCLTWAMPAPRPNPSRPWRSRPVPAKRRNRRLRGHQHRRIHCAKGWIRRLARASAAKGNYDWNAFCRSIETCLLGRKTDDAKVCPGMPEPSAERRTTSFHALQAAASPRVMVVSKDVWSMGGAELVAALVDCGQVDEFIIHVIPKMLGEGIPMVDRRRRISRQNYRRPGSFPTASSDCTTPSAIRFTIALRRGAGFRPRRAQWPLGQDFGVL